MSDFEFQRHLPVPGNRQGRLMCARGEDDTVWRLYDAGGRILLGKANTLVRGDMLQLSDIKVEPSVGLPHPSRWKKLFGHTVRVDLRRTGLGGHLIREVQAEARRRGLRGVTGMFTPEREEDAPNLLKFYRRHGFGLRGNTVFWIADSPSG